MITLLLLLLLGQTNSLSDSFTDHFYRYCCENATCAINFELSGCSSTYEYQRFGYMLDYLLHEQMLVEALFETDATHVVLEGMMRGHRFCLSNEIMELERGCVCRHDRRCHVKEPADLRVAPWILVLIVLLASGFILFYGITIIKKQKKIEKMMAAPGAVVPVGHYATLDKFVKPYDETD